MPPLPDLAHLDYLNTSIDASRAVPVASAQQEVAFLTATRSGATILGTLRKHSWGGIGSPIAGARVVLSSGGREIETVTKEDGGFAVSGIPAGRIEIRPVLAADLTVVNKSALTRDLRDGACDQVQLTAAVNGRVRGRIIGASRSSFSVPQMVDGKERRLVTFYPGASGQSSATALTVGEATQHDGFDFVVRSE